MWLAFKIHSPKVWHGHLLSFHESKERKTTMKILRCKKKRRNWIGLTHKWQVLFGFVLMDITFQSTRVNKDGNKIFETQPFHPIMEQKQLN
jgi:hypothetical protein